MTKVINIYGSSSTGKSTTAAMLYAYLKNKLISAELVREYCKSLVFQERSITNMDQYYIMGKEIHNKEILFGKVDYLISDSPLQQGNFYLHRNRPDLNFDSLGPLDPMIFDFISEAEKKGVEFYNFMVYRTSMPFETNGRYQTEEQSNKDHEDMKHFLMHPIRNKFLNLIDIKGDKEERIKQIVEIIGLDNDK